ncbi:uncharacterized protein [Venturia canescens]|uniref:uncharacterized protein isoform X1 n=1 Tax=Venturia canescens TaxID=32260 RepID=UPI001C9CE286|nr:uncharacterized protein LOC122412037 isoform X1 [Venturia canescens]
MPEVGDFLRAFLRDEGVQRCHYFGRDGLPDVLYVFLRLKFNKRFKVAPARPDASKLQELINTQKKYLSDMDRAMIDVHDSFTSAFLKSGKENKKNDLIRTRGPFFEDLKKVYNKLSAFDLSGYDLESEEFDDLINECDTKIGELKDLNLLIKN